MDRKADRCHMSCKKLSFAIGIFPVFFVRKSCWQMLSWNPEKKIWRQGTGPWNFSWSPKLPQPWFTSIHPCFRPRLIIFDSCCDLGTSSRDGPNPAQKGPQQLKMLWQMRTVGEAALDSMQEKNQTGSAASLPWAIHHLTPESQYLAVKVLQRHVDTANHVCAKHCAIPLLQATSAIHC